MAKRAEAIMVNLENYISIHVLGGQCDNFEEIKARWCHGNLDLVVGLCCQPGVEDVDSREQWKLVEEAKPLVYM